MLWKTLDVYLPKFDNVANEILFIAVIIAARWPFGVQARDRSRVEQGKVREAENEASTKDRMKMKKRRKESSLCGRRARDRSAIGESLGFELYLYIHKPR